MLKSLFSCAEGRPHLKWKDFLTVQLQSMKNISHFRRMIGLNIYSEMELNIWKFCLLFHWIHYFALLGFFFLQMSGLLNCLCFFNFTSFKVFFN